MKLFGITGGIGMGKSTAGNLLLGQGYPLIDTDTIARQVVEPGQEAVNEIQRCFGGAVISDNGKVRRDELAKIVFFDPAAREKLEAILHPRIRQVWQAEVQRWRSEGKAVGFVIIPLLFETGAVGSFDAVICVACSRATQMKRLQARGWNPGEIEGRIVAQWPVEKKIDASDYVVWTESHRDILGAQLRRILAEIR